MIRCAVRQKNKRNHTSDPLFFLNDIANADVILARGGTPAENHPAAFGHITIAKERGAKLISVDPRFTRTSARADIYCPLRSGTDIAFLGGMIKYILENKLYFEEYVREYTNATFLVNPDFKLPGDNDGVFSGLSGTKISEGFVSGKYDKTTWSFQKNSSPSASLSRPRSSWASVIECIVSW